MLMLNKSAAWPRSVARTAEVAARSLPSVSPEAETRSQGLKSSAVTELSTVVSLGTVTPRHCARIRSHLPFIRLLQIQISTNPVGIEAATSRIARAIREVQDKHRRHFETP